MFTMKPLTQAMFLLSLSPVVFAAVPHHALPTQGQVSQGNAHIHQSNANNTASMTITQNSQQAAIDWQSFNIGKHANVTFVQPNAQAAALNRVANGSSEIAGSLNANGHVYLLNPNGIIFSPTAQVNVGSLVASTGSMSDADWQKNKKNISINPQNNASIINQGRLTAAQGGEVVLHAKQVLNNGNIIVENGKVAGSTAAGKASLLAGTALRINVTRDGLIQSELAPTAVAEQFRHAHVENTGTITAHAANVTLQSLGNDSQTKHSGSITAHSDATHKTKVLVLAGKNSQEGLGTTTVTGSINAAAPASGNGGFVETSAAKVSIADTAKITTTAKNGNTGTWLIDPTDFTISTGTAAQTANGIGNTTLENNLATTDVEIETQASGGDKGDIYVNAPVSWNANKLTLKAVNDIHINAVMNVGTDANSTATLALNPASNVGSVQGNPQGKVKVGINKADATFKGKVNFSKSGKNLLTIGGEDYTVINTLGDEGSTTDTDLQGINGSTANLAGKYALGSDIDASVTSSWNNNSGFNPIGTENTEFSGVINGLGHSIIDLTVERENNAGLVGFLNEGGKVSNLLLDDGKITGENNVGIVAKAGKKTQIYNVINNLDEVKGKNYVGGILGRGVVSTAETTKIENSINKADITASEHFAGGIVAEGADIAFSRNSGKIAAGERDGSGYKGGLAGGLAAVNPKNANIENSYNTGEVQANAITGGLVAMNNGTIKHSFNKGKVVSIQKNATGLLEVPNSDNSLDDLQKPSGTGGIAGITDSNASIQEVYNTAEIDGGVNTGGLVGYLQGTLKDSYNTGEVVGTSNVGGAVGNINGGSVTTSYNIGKASGTNMLGGLIGNPGGSVSNSFFDKDKNATSAGGTPRTLAELKQQNTYTGDWDFTNTWEIVEGVSTPLLKNAYKTPLTLTANQSETYTGNDFSASNVSLTGTGYLDGDTEGSLIGSKQFVDKNNLKSNAVKNVGDYKVTGLYSQKYKVDMTDSKFAITQATAQVSVTDGRAYDTTKDVNANLLQVTGVNGESLTLTGTGKAASANVGTHAVSTAGLKLKDGTSGKQGIASNYKLADNANNSINITPATATVSVTKGRAYDTTTDVNANLLQVTGVKGETLTLTGTGKAASANVGTHAVKTSDLSLGNGTSGKQGIASNYKLADNANNSINITQATAQVSVTDGRAYDTTTDVNANLLQVTGVNGESLTLTGKGEAANANVGTHAVSTAGLKLKDGTGSNKGDADNYKLAKNTTNQIGISKKALSLTFSPKQYDGNNRLTASKITATGINNESVPLQGHATLSSADAGQQDIVDIRGLRFTDAAQANNYSLPRTGLSKVTVLAAPTQPTTPTTPSVPTTPSTPAAPTTPSVPTIPASVQKDTKIDDFKVMHEVAQPQLRPAILDNSSPFSAADSLLSDFESLAECEENPKNKQAKKECISKPIVTDTQLKDDDNSPAVAIQKKYALVIGNSNYQHVTALSGAKNDSLAISNLLKAKGYQVTQVNDATKTDMISSLNHLVRNTSLHDSVLIYYAGHGYIHQQSQEGYWIPVDAQVASPSKWLANQDIVRFLKNIPAKQIMLVSDSCFSGAFTYESAENTKQLDDNAVLKRRSAVVISSGDIEVVKDKVVTNSPFATEFMGILKQKEQPNIRAKQLSQDIADKLARYYQQKPQYGTLYSAGHISGGDYILKLK